MYFSFTEFRIFHTHLCVYVLIVVHSEKTGAYCTVSKRIEDQKISYFEHSCGYKRVINCSFIF